MAPGVYRISQDEDLIFGALIVGRTVYNPQYGQPGQPLTIQMPDRINTQNCDLVQLTAGSNNPYGPQPPATPRDVAELYGVKLLEAYTGTVTLKQSGYVQYLGIANGRLNQADPAQLNPAIPLERRAGQITVNVNLSWLGGDINTTAYSGYLNLAATARGTIDPGNGDTVSTGDTITLLGNTTNQTGSILRQRSGTLYFLDGDGMNVNLLANFEIQAQQNRPVLVDGDTSGGKNKLIRNDGTLNFYTIGIPAGAEDTTADATITILPVMNSGKVYVCSNTYVTTKGSYLFEIDTDTFAIVSYGQKQSGTTTVYAKGTLHGEHGIYLKGVMNTGRYITATPNGAGPQQTGYTESSNERLNLLPATLATDPNEAVFFACDTYLNPGTTFLGTIHVSSDLFWKSGKLSMYYNSSFELYDLLKVSGSLDVSPSAEIKLQPLNGVDPAPNANPRKSWRVITASSFFSTPIVVPHVINTLPPGYVFTSFVNGNGVEAVGYVLR